MVTRLGCDVGMIISELERLGIAKDTVVVFAADNVMNFIIRQMG